MTIDHWRTTPTLPGAHVLLRPTVLADVAGLAQAFDTECTRYFLYGQHSEPPTEASVSAALASEQQVLTQVEVSTGEIVGTTSLYDMSEVDRRVTVGSTWLAQRVRGSAVNSESKLLLLDHCFGALGAGRVQFNVDNLNERSQRAVGAIGATREGELRNHARRRDGSFRNTIVLSVIEQEWPHLRARLVERINRRVLAR